MDNLKIRAWRHEDLDDLVRLADNLKVARNLRDKFPHPYTRQDGEKFLNRVVGKTDQPIFAMEVDGRAAGGIGYHFGEDVHRRGAEIGYWLGEPYWGRGIATEALRRMIPIAFQNPELHRLWAISYHDNPASQRVLEKAGFTYEGRLRQSAYRLGEFKDELYYTILRKEE